MWGYNSPASFNAKSSNYGEILKLVFLISSKKDFTDGIAPSILALIIIPIVPVIVKPKWVAIFWLCDHQGLKCFSEFLKLMQ